MSEPIPESIPTSADPRSKRPTKRLALTPTSQQATSLTALFAKPDREIPLPSTSLSSSHHNNPLLAPPPEIVANVQGSSAGAGSGEFHVYKASRRREYERLRLMDEEAKREKADETFEKEKEERRRKDEAKTNKNKARREKIKAKKKGGKGEKSDYEGMKGVETTLRKDSVYRVKNSSSDQERGKDGRNNERELDGVKAMAEEIGVTIHDDD